MQFMLEKKNLLLKKKKYEFILLKNSLKKLYNDKKIFKF